MKKVVIYRATEAFLYLPTYIAEHRQTFQTVNKKLEVKSYTLDRQESGDVSAIKTMIKNRHKDDTLPIALCDPLAIFDPDVCAPLQPKDLRLIGALITKPSFWCVNGAENELPASEIKKYFKDFEKLIYYNETLATGNFLGKRLQDEAGILNGNPVNFGEEIKLLLEEHKSGKKAIAVTADIVGLAKAYHAEENISINYRFSTNPDYSDFLTTGLITTAEVCASEENGTILEEVVEGIQRAIFVLRSSKDIALSVCQEIAKDEKFYQEGEKKLKKKEVSWIIDQLHEENFYPTDLAISKSQWVNAVEARGDTKSWQKEKRKKIKNMYRTVVEQKFLKKSKRHIVNEFGIPKPPSPIKGVLEKSLKMLLDDAVPLIIRVGLMVTLFAGLLLPPDLEISLLPFLNLQLSARPFMVGIALFCLLMALCCNSDTRATLARRRNKIILGVTLPVLTAVLFSVATWLDMSGKPSQWAWTLGGALISLLISGVYRFMAEGGSTEG